MQVILFTVDGPLVVTYDQADQTEDGQKHAYDGFLCLLALHGIS